MIYNKPLMSRSADLFIKIIIIVVKRSYKFDFFGNFPHYDYIIDYKKISIASCARFVTVPHYFFLYTLAAIFNSGNNVNL